MFISDELPNIPDVYYYVNAARATIEEYEIKDFKLDPSSLYPDYVLVVRLQNEKGQVRDIGLFGNEKNGWEVKVKPGALQFMTNDIDYAFQIIWRNVKRSAYSRANALLKEYQQKCPELML